MNWNGASLFLQKMLFMAKKTVNVVFFLIFATALSFVPKWCIFTIFANGNTW